MRKLVFISVGLLCYLSLQPWAVRHLFGPEPWRYAVPLAGFFAFLVFQNVPYLRHSAGIRLNALMGGYVLAISGALSLLLDGVALFVLYTRLTEPLEPLTLALDLAVGLLAAFVSLFNGFLRMVLLGRQVGFTLKVLWLLLWWCPVVNLVLTCKICHRVRREYFVELAKIETDAVRQENLVCSTQYPVLLVHGVFFRDWQFFNYWGRIPAELQRNGCRVYYGHHQSAASVADSASELAQQILSVIQSSGAPKVNIIAHSKGGLDARYAISRLGMDKFVASLTTINTPHRGCLWAESLLLRLPSALVRFVAARYDSLFSHLGDSHPDFLAAVNELTASAATVRNDSTPDAPGVLYQSVMSKMNSWRSAHFPLNAAFLLVKPVEGDNDGLVATSSAYWGRQLPLVTNPRGFGVSHGDMIDLFRENINGFDVREFYVSLVASLKQQGL